MLKWQRQKENMHRVIHSPKIYIIFVCLVLSLGAAQKAHASFVVIQNLHFGEFIIQDNRVSHRLTINPDGSYTPAPSFIEITPPKPGIYQIDNLTPNSIINVTAVQIQPMVGANNFFTLENFQVSHSNVDQAGLATITLGADAVTSGNGSPYTDDTYTGQIQIQISF